MRCGSFRKLVRFCCRTKSTVTTPAPLSTDSTNTISVPRSRRVTRPLLGFGLLHNIVLRLTRFLEMSTDEVTPSMQNYKGVWLRIDDCVSPVDAVNFIVVFFIQLAVNLHSMVLSLLSQSSYSRCSRTGRSHFVELWPLKKKAHHSMEHLCPSYYTTSTSSFCQHTAGDTSTGDTSTAVHSTTW